jgi:hypothetical protein
VRSSLYTPEVDLVLEYESTIILVEPLLRFHGWGPFPWLRSTSLVSYYKFVELKQN